MTPLRRLASAGLWAILLGCASARLADPGLRDELVAMSAADQKVREELVAAGLERPDPEIAARMARIDAENLKRIKQIVSSRGWPGLSLVGEDGETAAFLLVQHADSDPGFQKAALPLLEAAFRAGQATGEHLALLTDRVLVAEGKPQLYGSQAEIVDGRIVVSPVSDADALDKRRAELGLPPMEEYLKLMRRMYSLPAAQESPGDFSTSQSLAPN